MSNNPVHLFPALGTFISVFGSTEGVGDLGQARTLNKLICKDDGSWSLVYLGATVRAWWIAEYSGWYLDDPIGSPVQGVDLDEEDMERSKQFMESLKYGAFDFMLSVAADCKAPDWQDPARSGMRQWLQRKSPPLASDPVPFSEFFQKRLMVQLEVFIDAFISNLPDVLRKLRVEEDEQRQLSQTHEQDLDLERFLIIIAYSYEGRPDSADAFWSDPDSNLAGFLHWASRRASTPLVSAFCDMLQALSDDEECATAAHEFLLDEGHHSSGKMRRTQSLTWGQIFKELVFFTNKIRERPSPTQSNVYRGGKPTSEQAETEPESAMMLECYLRLMTKLSAKSETARQMLLRDPNFNLVEVLYQLASSTIPARLRACVFYALQALLARMTPEEGQIMWRCVDSWITGGYAVQPSSHKSSNLGLNQTSPTLHMEAIFQEIGEGFEEPNAFTQLLITLTTPVEECGPLNDTLPFPEDLGSSLRAPGVELYVDYVLGHVFGNRSKDIQDTAQLRTLRLSCLDFALNCLLTFNEDLIIIGNESNIAIDTAISTTDLATYVRLHPFGRVMEWMFNDKVMEALFSTIHQNPAEVGKSAPDSTLILGILRSVEVITRVLELQTTYLDLVRPIIKLQAGQERQPVANAAYASFEDALMNHLGLVVDLGRFCGIGYPSLTLACLKLLEKILTSPKIIAAWNPESRRNGHRNKAIIALESEGVAEAMAHSLSSELGMTIDFVRGADTPNYMVKIFILDFLYECLKASPDQPFIVHLLGFQGGVNGLTVDPESAFGLQESLFHVLVNLVIEVPYLENEEDGIRGWLVALKSKALRILQILWNSPLSSAIVMDELRPLKFPFHLLLGKVLIQPHLRWDGQESGSAAFLLADSSLAYLDFLSIRTMAFEYIGMELCSVSQSRMPTFKRELLGALLAGQVKGDENEPIGTPNAFDLYDFMDMDGQWEIPPPEFTYLKDLDLRACVEESDHIVLYDISKVREVLLLKQNESRNAGLVVSESDLAAMEKEEALLLEYLVYSNRVKAIAARRRKALQAWTRLVLVMVETNDFKGTDKASFLQQALQTILPSLDTLSADGHPEALELAKLANVLLFKTDFSLEGGPSSPDKGALAKGTPISDKLFQLFQICLNAIGRWAGDAELRSVYYSICYRYLTGVVNRGEAFRPDRQKAMKAIQVYGEKLLNVICDDAFGGDTGCQTAAMILLGALVNLERSEDDTGVVETLNRLNFIGILVDSLKTLLHEWLEIIKTGNTPAEHYTNAKLSLLLQLCQSRPGAKHVLHANLFRAVELSRLFAVDPELEMDPTDAAALGRHYGLLVRVARVVAAAVLGRGSHSVPQGRRFLTQHRPLVVHTLKRSAGIGTPQPPPNSTASTATTVAAAQARAELEDRTEELAEAFMALIAATGFLEVSLFLVLFSPLPSFPFLSLSFLPSPFFLITCLSLLDPYIWTRG